MSDRNGGALSIQSSNTDFQAVVGAAPYVVRRRVRWGECDAGNIVYTANFLDYAIETVEAWFLAVTRVHWSELAPKHRLGHPFAKAEIDFVKMLVGNADFTMELRLTKIGSTSYESEIVGRDATGETVFVSRLRAVFVSVDSRRPIPIPPLFRDALAAYRRDCGEELVA